MALANKNSVSPTTASGTLLDSLPLIIFQPIEGNDKQKEQNAIFLRSIQKQGLDLVLAKGFGQDDALYANKYASENFPRSHYPPNTINADTNMAYRSEVWKRYVEVLFAAPVEKNQPSAPGDANFSEVYRKSKTEEKIPGQGQLNYNLLGQIVPEKTAIKGIPPKEQPSTISEETKPPLKEEKETTQPVQEKKINAADLMPAREVSLDEFEQVISEIAKIRPISCQIFLDKSNSVEKHAKKISAAGSRFVKISKKYENISAKRGTFPVDQEYYFEAPIVSQDLSVEYVEERDVSLEVPPADLDNNEKAIRQICQTKSKFKNYVFVTDGGNLDLSKKLIKESAERMNTQDKTLHILYPSGKFYSGILGAVFYLCYLTGGTAASLQKATRNDLAKMITQETKTPYSDIAEFVTKNGLSAFDILSLAEHLKPNRLFEGIDPNKADSSGQILIICAVYGGELEMVKFLASGGADVNQADAYGQIPIVMAAKNGHLEIVKFLYSKGAKRLEDALRVAKKEGKTDVVKFLRSKGVK